MNKIIEEDLKFITSANLPWEQFEGKNILIAGANGFVPVYMLKTLQYLNNHQFENPCNIYALVRNATYKKLKFELDNRTFLIDKDVCGYTPLAHMDYIMHAASRASPKFFKENPIDIILPNIVGTYKLLESIKNDPPIAFLFFSSGEIYGNLGDESISESCFGNVNTMDIRSCYPESKRMGENLCMCYSYKYNISTKIARLFHVYGPGISLDDGRLFADFISDIINKRDIQLESDGKDMRTFCYLADATIALFTILLKGKTAEAYNLANRFTETSVYGLAQLLTSLYPEYGLQVKFGKLKDCLQRKVRKSMPDTLKLESLGWQPAFDLKNGFKRTIESYLGEVK